MPNGDTVVYTIASFGTFGFENGIFTKISGTGSIPTVMIFSKPKDGNYVFEAYKEPMDGSYYVDSLKKLFPKRLHKQVLASQESYQEVIEQLEQQAKEYLQTIGREAIVQAKHVEKKLSTIHVEASNKIFAEHTKFDQFLNDCPYWIGTRERVENGIRYIYKTEQTLDTEGFDVIIFSKTDAHGNIIERREYKIVGPEPIVVKK
ncbi:transcriptional regulator [Desulfuribacillus stibiiarsenatis]|uniref:Transcriptional regulator n=2 Tax=Desulfuribacillus stibiiarsenatis TaxID=1390249 RepID=A0A1E5LAP5_9FIRM|nr:transcriptional regulator [Desulfuribacillus stibiiarsenatis]